MHHRLPRTVRPPAVIGTVDGRYRLRFHDEARSAGNAGAGGNAWRSGKPGVRGGRYVRLHPLDAGFYRRLVAQETLVAAGHRSDGGDLGLLDHDRRVHAGVSPRNAGLQLCPTARDLALRRCLPAVRGLVSLLPALPRRGAATMRRHPPRSYHQILQKASG